MHLVLLLHLLLLPHLSWGGGGEGEGWRCPSVTPPPPITCTCSLPHTLRCDGSLGTLPLSSLLSSLTSLPPRHLTLLDLSVRGAPSLPPRALAPLQVEGLVVSTGSLRHLPARAFAGLEASLTALGLPGNALASVPTQALAPLTRLARLDLSSNSLTSLPSLPALPDLELLSLASNSLASLASGVFQAVPHLRTLQLAGNRLSMAAIYHYNLQHLSYLSSLDLSRNRLAGPLSPPSLDLFPPNLRSLDLSLNTITSLASRTFASLTSLTSLSLEGNLVEEVQGEAFQGLTSLTSLDLSHNSILTLATSSLAGLPSLTTLNLAHNHLQVVDSSMVAPSSPLLASLLLMDNDITTVVGLALEQATHLEELDLTGNPLSCDCHLGSLYTWLTSPPSSSSSSSSAVCSTPPTLSNAPLASLPSPPTCTEEGGVGVAEGGGGGGGGDYYEYYTEPVRGAHPTFLSSAELQLVSSSYQASPPTLSLLWHLGEAALPYTCGQLHVFQESPELGPVPVLQQPLHCSSSSNSSSPPSSSSPSTSSPSPSLLSVTVPLAGVTLSPTQPYIFCISLLQDASVTPGCSSALTLGSPHTRVISLEEQVHLSHLRANVSLDGTEVAVALATDLPPSFASSCTLHLSLSSPTSSPTLHLATTTINCSTTVHTFRHLAPHTYYNVCAVVEVSGGRGRGEQCLLAAAPRLRQAARSVMPLVLSLVFLALGIACLTVLYLIVRQHRQDSSHTAWLHHRRVSPLLGLCWKLARRPGAPALFLDTGDMD